MRISRLLLHPHRIDGLRPLDPLVAGIRIALNKRIGG